MSYMSNNKTPVHKIQMMNLNHKFCAGEVLLAGWLAGWMGVVQYDIIIIITVRTVWGK
jgi:hypothetical protein